MKPGRVFAVARKEAIHILRDPRSMGMGLAMPVLLMVLFGWALSLDVEEVPLGVLDLARTPESRALVQSFDASGGFGMTEYLTGYDALSEAIDRREIAAALVIDGCFSDSIVTGASGRVQLILDGSDSRTARAASGYARSIVSSFAPPGSGRIPPASPVEIRVANWYNPSRETRNAIIPGLSAVILMVVVFVAWTRFAPAPRRPRHPRRHPRVGARERGARPQRPLTAATLRRRAQASACSVRARPARGPRRSRALPSRARPT
mgnify:CR=1 FL=1